MIQTSGPSANSSISSSSIILMAPYFFVFLSKRSFCLCLVSGSSRLFFFFLGTGLRFNLQPLLSYECLSLSYRKVTGYGNYNKNRSDFHYFAKNMTIWPGQEIRGRWRRAAAPQKRPPGYGGLRFALAPRGAGAYCFGGLFSSNMASSSLSSNVISRHRNSLVFFPPS
jgi:hypothetical protein